MANYLEANPDVAGDIAGWRETGQFVPFAVCGEFAGGINRRLLDRIKPDASLTVANYVVGMELLGVTLHIVDTDQGRFLHQSLIFEPAGWVDRATQLVQAFGPGREGEIADFLTARGDKVIGTTSGEAA